MQSTARHPAAYVARYRLDLGMVLGRVAVTAYASLILHGIFDLRGWAPFWLLFLGFCAPLGLPLLPYARRRVALRVDQDGVTVVKRRYGRREYSVPWGDVAEVALFEQFRSRWLKTPLRYVALRLRPGTPIPGLPDGWRKGAAMSLLPLAGLTLPHVDLADYMVGRPIIGWHLDPERLAAAMAAFAPGLPLVHIERDGSRTRLN